MSNPEPSKPEAVYRSSPFAKAIDPSGGDVDLVGITLNNSATTVTIASARRLRCAGAGNVNVQFPNGSTAILAFLAGESQEVQVRKVFQTSTTATGIVAYW